MVAPDVPVERTGVLFRGVGVRLVVLVPDEDEVPVRAVIWPFPVWDFARPATGFLPFRIPVDVPIDLRG